MHGEIPPQLSAPPCLCLRSGRPPDQGCRAGGRGGGEAAPDLRCREGALETGFSGIVPISHDYAFPVLLFLISSSFNLQV